MTGKHGHALLGGGGLFVCVGLIAWLVWGGWLSAADRTGVLTLALVRPRDPAWMIDLAQWISWLGDGARRPYWLVGGVGLALLWRRWRAAAFCVLGFAMAVFASDAIKEIMGRPRPRLTPWLDDPHSFSFPSGHATAAMALALGIALAVPPGRARIWAFSLGLPLAIGVGVSRVMLGVHWPSDVVAGWALGAGMVLMANAVSKTC